MTSKLEPNAFFRFDIARGVFEVNRKPTDARAARAEHARVFPLPQFILRALVGRAEDTDSAAETFDALGRHLAETVKESVPTAPVSQSPEDGLAVISDILAIFGWGRLSMESWGDLLVLRLAPEPYFDKRRQLVSQLLSGLFSSLTESDAECVPLQPGAFAVVSPETAGAVRAWVARGESLASMLPKLERRVS